MLVICSYTDYKTRMIDLRVVYFFLLLNILMRGRMEIEPVGLLLSLIPGMMLMTVRLIKKTAIGEGDLHIFIALGIMTGFYHCLMLLLLSSVLLLLYGVFYIWPLKKERDRSVPFVPFILLSHVVISLVGYREEMGFL